MYVLIHFAPPGTRLPCRKTKILINQHFPIFVEDKLTKNAPRAFFEKAGEILFQFRFRWSAFDRCAGSRQIRPFHKAWSNGERANAEGFTALPMIAVLANTSPAQGSGQVQQNFRGFTAENRPVRRESFKQAAMIGMRVGEQHTRDWSGGAKAYRNGSRRVIRRIQRSPGIQQNTLAGGSHNFNAVTPNGIDCSMDTKFHATQICSFFITACKHCHGLTNFSRVTWKKIKKAAKGSFSPLLRAI
jgi:hypothetical protein